MKEIKIAARGKCTLTMGFVRGMHKAYIMRGPSGAHYLAINEAGKERMMAHWKGFCNYNKEKARQFNLPSGF